MRSVLSRRAAALCNQWLAELTALPTVAGHEDQPIAWVRKWVAKRRDLRLIERPGGLMIGAGRLTRARGARRPLFITAHLDHPGFVVLEAPARDRVTLEFRGGVHRPYFEHARIEILDRLGQPHAATVLEYNADAEPFPRVIAALERPAASIVSGNLGRWRFEEPLPKREDGRFHARACDDLAGVAAALSALESLRRRPESAHVRVLLTRAEEVGFIGAIDCCKAGWLGRSPRLLCLETSRSFADSPIGAGPIVRVGDRTSVFGPSLTNLVGEVAQEHADRTPAFTWQRKLMSGGTCEATTFSAYGYESTCLCLPLGNYHNMIDIEDVQRGLKPARMGPEIISIDDYHALIELLVVLVTRLDVPRPSLERRMETLYARHANVLRDSVNEPSVAHTRQRRR